MQCCQKKLEIAMPPPQKRKKLVMALYKLNEIIFIYSVISKKVNVML